MRYREIRLPCDTEVAVILGEELRRARFVNINASGARMEGLGRVPRDALVTLAHLTLRVAARVVWTNDRQAGLRFVQPLPPSEISALRGVGDPRTGAWPPQAVPRFREMT